MDSEAAAEDDGEDALDRPAKAANLGGKLAAAVSATWRGVKDVFKSQQEPCTPSPPAQRRRLENAGIGLSAHTTPPPHAQASQRCVEVAKGAGHTATASQRTGWHGVRAVESPKPQRAQALKRTGWHGVRAVDSPPPPPPPCNASYDWRAEALAQGVVIDKGKSGLLWHGVPIAEMRSCVVPVLDGVDWGEAHSRLVVEPDLRDQGNRGNFLKLAPRARGENVAHGTTLTWYDGIIVKMMPSHRVPTNVAGCAYVMDVTGPAGAYALDACMLPRAFSCDGGSGLQNREGGVAHMAQSVTCGKVGAGLPESCFFVAGEDYENPWGAYVTLQYNERAENPENALDVDYHWMVQSCGRAECNNCAF